MRNLEELFVRINVSPNDVSVYELALTHPSFNADANTRHSDYERFEYMGDAVLDYVAADLIFKSFPDMEPGRMSKLRSYLVKTHSLSNYARNIELYNYIKVGNSLSASHIQQSDRILEDSFEALIGAIYLDQGIEFVYNFIKNVLFEDVLKAAVVISDAHDDNMLIMDNGALYVSSAGIASNKAEITSLKNRMKLLKDIHFST